MSQFPERMVAVMNKSIEPGRIMNSLAHMTIALGAKVGEQRLALVDYSDADGNAYPNISKMPFIVLRANSNKIQTLYKQANENNINSLAFTDTMTIGTWQQQLDKTKLTKKDDLIFYGVILIGDAGVITQLTQKFSLWK